MSLINTSKSLIVLNDSLIMEDLSYLYKYLSTYRHKLIDRHQYRFSYIFRHFFVNM